MFISGRRAKWMLFGMLLLLAAVLCRPVRVWTNQVVLARALHPNLQFSELRLSRNHLREDILLFHGQHWDWGAVQGDRCVGLTSDNVWLAVEKWPLLSKRLSIPRAILSDARLTLVSAPDSLEELAGGYPTDSTGAAIVAWQKSRDFASEKELWNENFRRIDRMLHIDDVLDQCQSSIQTWISESERLTNSAAALIASPEFGNSLRIDVQDDLRAESIRQLQQQQLQLAEEFTSIEQVLKDNFEQIQHLLDQVCGEFQLAHGKMNLENGDAFEKQSRDVARMLVEAAAQKSFDYAKPFAEVSDLLFRATTDLSRPSYDRDYRPAGTEFLLVDRLTANGIFLSDTIRSRFQLDMHCRILHQDPQQLKVIGQAHFHFPTPRFKIQVTHSCTNQDSSTGNIQVWLQTPPGSSDSAAGEAESTAAVTTMLANPQLNLFARGDVLSGCIVLDQHSLVFLADLAPDLFEKLMEQHSEYLYGTEFEPVEFQLDGCWKEVRCRMHSDAPPEWLQSTIQSMRRENFDRQQRERFAALDDYLQEQLDRLDHQIHQVLDQAGQRVQQTRHSMLAVCTQLQQQNEKAKQVEFARSEQDEVQR